MAKVSVIIPIFRVEKYIEECVRSLFHQDLNDVEFIFIDDCTPDNSMAILNRIIDENRLNFERNHWCVKIEKMPSNSGVAAIRKYGIMISSGEYVSFCDSDDFLDSSMLKFMYEKAIKDDADIIICDYYELKANRLRYKKSIPYHCISNMDYIIGMLTHHISCSVWNKMVKRSLFDNNINYPVCGYGEDMALMTQLFFYTNKITYFTKPLYYYRLAPNSISRNKSNDAILSAYKNTCENAKLIEVFFNNRSREKRLNDAIECLKAFERDRILPLSYNNEYYNKWINTFPEINNSLLFNRYISAKHKLRFLLGICRLYHVIYNFKKIYD